jgi:AcrR family transcriptional regulator
LAGAKDRISAHRGRSKNDPRDAARVQFEQRARILEAVAHQVAAGGYGAMGIDPIVHIAGLSRRTVYDLFPHGTPVLIMAAHQAAIDYSLARVLAAFDAQGDWASGFCAGIDAYARLLRSSEVWARLWVAESLGAPAEARALGRTACDLLIERLEPAVGSRAAAQAMLDVIDGATRRALRDGKELPTDEIAAIALRPVASPSQIRAALAGVTRAPRRLRPRLVELEYEAGRLPDPDARRRLEGIVAAAGAARDGLTLWRLFIALAPPHVDDPSRTEVRDLIVEHLPHSLHFGVPLTGAMRLA